MYSIDYRHLQKVMIMIVTTRASLNDVNTDELDIQLADCESAEMCMLTASTFILLHIILLPTLDIVSVQFHNFNPSSHKVLHKLFLSARVAVNLSNGTEFRV